MGERTEFYEREKLYEEIWKEPVLAVANRYGVSNVALAKACRKLAVPLPPRGYWAKVQAGRKAPPRPPLPPYENPSKVQATRPVSGRSGAAASKVTDEKPGHGPTTSTLRVPETSGSPSSTERKTEEKKRNLRKSSPKEIPEYLYCTIDGWQRTFRFGVNRLGPIKGLQEEKEPYDEWDHLQIFATIRYHDKTVKGRKRTGQRVELWFFPTHVPRKDWREDPDAVGGVWTEQGRLFGSLHVPADSFYSLFPPAWLQTTSRNSYSGSFGCVIDRGLLMESNSLRKRRRWKTCSSRLGRPARCGKKEDFFLFIEAFSVKGADFNS